MALLDLNMLAPPKPAAMEESALLEGAGQRCHCRCAVALPWGGGRRGEVAGSRQDLERGQDVSSSCGERMETDGKGNCGGTYVWIDTEGRWLGGEGE